MDGTSEKDLVYSKRWIGLQKRIRYILKDRLDFRKGSGIF